MLHLALNIWAVLFIGGICLAIVGAIASCASASTYRAREPEPEPTPLGKLIGKVFLCLWWPFAIAYTTRYLGMW